MNALASLTGLLVAISSSLPAQTSGVMLRGKVEDPSGKPISGVRVGIATAAPRVGPSLFCPSCYVDCRKWARSDDQGRFVIEGLDSTLKFTVLVSAPDRKARQTKLIDPLQGNLQITLQPLPPAFPAAQTIMARLVDDRGQPVAGALIEPAGGQKGEIRWGGWTADVDPTVTDNEGRFRLFLPKDYDGLDVRLTASAYAGAQYDLLKPGAGEVRLLVPAGTRVTGRVMQGGKPVSGLRLAVVQMDRGSNHFVGAVGAVTDAEGKFAFDHLPADQDYAIFSVVGAGPQKLVITTKRFKALGDRKER